MSVSELSCEPSLNPRFADRCFRCDQPLSAKPEPLRRNLPLEREIVREATRGTVDPDRLIEHAQNRAERLSAEYVPDPRLIARGKDRLREAREEAADGVNHCLFWLQEHDVEDDLRDDVMIALRFFALAYDRLLED